MNNIPLIIGFIFSLLMILGVLGIGRIIFKILPSYTTNNAMKILSGGEFLMAMILVSVVISWISLLPINRAIYELFAYSLILFGLYYILILLTYLRKRHINLKVLIAIPRVDLVLLVLLPVLYLLSNSGYITNADSIDYHIGYALNFLRENFDPHPEWYNGRMASIGEKINAIGVSIGAIQFGPLLQLSGYISIGFILTKSFGHRFYKNYIILLALWSSPVFLFLCISAKPQLLPTALSCFSFYLIFKVSVDKNITCNDKRIFILISLLLSSVAFTQKFNFIISYFFICIFILWVSKKYKVDIFYFFLALLIVSIFVITPAFLDKQIRYGATVIEYFLSPVSSKEISLTYFVDSVRKFKENAFPFPIYLLIPSSLGTVSTVLGVGVIFAVIPLLFKKTFSTFYLLIIASNILLLLILSMPASRFFLEPYIWLLILLGSSSLVINQIIKNFLVTLVRLQAIVVIIALLPISIYTAAELIGLGFSDYKYKYIYGYNLQRWYAKELPPKASILLDHRSVSLADRNAITFEVHEYGKHDFQEHQSLLAQLEKYQVEYVVTVDRSSSFRDIEVCSEQLLFGPEEFIFATRNPFNSGVEYGYIFKIKPQNFINCLMIQ